MEWIALAGVGCTVALGLVLAAAIARIAQLQRAVETIARDVPSEVSVRGFIEEMTRRQRLSDSRDPELRESQTALVRHEVRRCVRREMKEILARPEFHERLEIAVRSEVARATVERILHQSLEEALTRSRRHVAAS